MKLYFAPRTRATRPRWLLEELGVPYELVRLDLKAGEHKKPEYLAIHPLGVVPVLVDGDLKVYESSAICLYLADKFADKGLAPPLNSPERGSYYKWIAYAVSSLEPQVGDYAAHAMTHSSAKRDPARAEKAKEHLAIMLPLVAAELKGREYLTGRFSAADVIMGSLLGWAKSMKLLDDQPVLADYVRRLTARPAAVRANS